MKTDWRIEGPQLLILASMFMAAALAWPTAPDRIPVHWNIAGEVDRYSGKFQGLLLLPLVALAQYALMRLLPRIDPGRANYRTFAGAYDIVRLTTLAVLALAYGLQHLWLRGNAVDSAVVGPLLMAAFFIVLGNLSGKLRPNWFIGIRTPWTLSSKAAWTRTHRVGGWFMVVFGLALMASVLLAEPRTVRVVLFGGLLSFVCWSMAYSYWVWRHDPDKVAPAGTLPSDE